METGHRFPDSNPDFVAGSDSNNNNSPITAVVATGKAKTNSNFDIIQRRYQVLKRPTMMQQSSPWANLTSIRRQAVGELHAKCALVPLKKDGVMPLLRLGRSGGTARYSFGNCSSYLVLTFGKNLETESTTMSCASRNYWQSKHCSVLTERTAGIELYIKQEANTVKYM
jgi:hypothetical protein